MFLAILRPQVHRIHAFLAVPQPSRLIFGLGCNEAHSPWYPSLYLGQRMTSGFTVNRTTQNICVPHPTTNQADPDELLRSREMQHIQGSTTINGTAVSLKNHRFVSLLKVWPDCHWCHNCDNWKPQIPLFWHAEVLPPQNVVLKNDFCQFPIWIHQICRDAPF